MCLPFLEYLKEVYESSCFFLSLPFSFLYKFPFITSAHLPPKATVVFPLLSLPFSSSQFTANTAPLPPVSSDRMKEPVRVHSGEFSSSLSFGLTQNPLHHFFSLKLVFLLLSSLLLLTVFSITNL